MVHNEERTTTMKMFQVPSTISKVMTMGDHSLRLQVDIDRELNPEENAQVFALYNHTGFFVFKDVEIMESDTIDLPEEIKEFKTEKSSSEILRNRLYIYYTKTFGKKEGYEIWRKNEMDRIGLHYLDKVKDK
jgi:hypothetical protein